METVDNVTSIPDFIDITEFPVNPACANMNIVSFVNLVAGGDITKLGPAITDIITKYKINPNIINSKNETGAHDKFHILASYLVSTGYFDPTCTKIIS